MITWLIAGERKSSMRALLSKKQNNRIHSEIIECSPPEIANGEALIQVEYSSLNYKDALAITGQGSIFRSLPLIGGIDLAGQIIKSKSSLFSEGEPVLVTGGGTGETRHGGFSEFVAIHENNIISRKNLNLSAHEAMIYGTAGFTAALALERLLQNGQIPEMGPILVTGASGGVGQFAVYFLNKIGFDVTALTSKTEHYDRLLALGAKRIIQPIKSNLDQKPLERIQFGGAIDNLGGETLSKIIAQVELWGSVACIGLAESSTLNTTVMPFILRGVSLLGVSSNNTPQPLRSKIWKRLASDLKPNCLADFVSQTIKLEDLNTAAHDMLNRKTHGRIIVRL